MSLAMSHRGLGFVYLDGGKYPEAIVQFTTSTQVLERAVAVDAKNVAARRALMKLVIDMGDAVQKLRRIEHGRVSDALPYLERANKIGNDLINEGPANELLQHDLARICQLYGSSLQNDNKAAEALPLWSVRSTSCRGSC
jgi:hypothetical protein